MVEHAIWTSLLLHGNLVVIYCFLCISPDIVKNTIDLKHVTGKTTKLEFFVNLLYFTLVDRKVFLRMQSPSTFFC